MPEESQGLFSENPNIAEQISAGMLIAVQAVLEEDVEKQMQVGELDALISTATRVLANKLHVDIVSGNPHGITKDTVGLGSVDNTPDTGKPVSTAQLAAIALREALSNKVTAFQEVPTHTNYPSEKLVKDSLDAISSTIGNIETILATI